MIVVASTLSNNTQSGRTGWLVVRTCLSHQGTHHHCYDTIRYERRV